MNKTKLALASFALVATTALTLGLHADPMDSGAKHRHGSMMGNMMGDMPMDHMKQELKLTDEQTAKIKAIHKAHMATMRTLKGEMKSDIMQLKDLVDKNSSEEKLKAGIESVRLAKVAMMDVQMKHHSEMQALLTPLQQAKMIIGMSSMMHDDMMDQHEGKDEAKEKESRDEKEEGSGK